MAVVHLPMKFGIALVLHIAFYLHKNINNSGLDKDICISLSNPELLIFFGNDGDRRHLGFVWVSHGTTDEASFVARTRPVKILS